MTDLKYLRAVIADLEIQSMMFDMPLDWETLQLMVKNTYEEPAWVTKWKDKDGDRESVDYQGWE